MVTCWDLWWLLEVMLDITAWQSVTMLSFVMWCVPLNSLPNWVASMIGSAEIVNGFIEDYQQWYHTFDIANCCSPHGPVFDSVESSVKMTGCLNDSFLILSSMTVCAWAALAAVYEFQLPSLVHQIRVALLAAYPVRQWWLVTPGGEIVLSVSCMHVDEWWFCGSWQDPL